MKCDVTILQPQALNAGGWLSHRNNHLSIRIAEAGERRLQRRQSEHAPVILYVRQLFILCSWVAPRLGSSWLYLFRSTAAVAAIFHYAVERHESQE